MSNKKVLVGPKRSVSRIDVIPTIFLGFVSVVLVTYGCFVISNRDCGNIKRDTIIFKAVNKSESLLANLWCEDGWNKTLLIDYNNSDSTLKRNILPLSLRSFNSTLKSKVNEDLTSNIIHDYTCQKCHVRMYDEGCYVCQTRLIIEVVKM